MTNTQAITMKNETIRFPGYLRKDILKRGKLEKKKFPAMVRAMCEAYLINCKNNNR